MDCLWRLVINAETTVEQRSADAQQQLRQHGCPRDTTEQDAALRQPMTNKLRFAAGLLTLHTLNDLARRWRSKGEPHLRNPLPQSAGSTPHLSLTRVRGRPILGL